MEDTKVNIAEDTNRCPKCSSIIENNNTKFCPKCGYKLISKSGTNRNNKIKNIIQPKWLWIFNGSCLLLLIIILAIDEIIPFLKKKAKSDYLKNEIVFKSKETENRTTFISDTIKLKNDTICLNMNPFTFETGLLLMKCSGKLKISGESELGAFLYLVFDIKNISTENFHGNVKVSWRMKNIETKAIQYSGTEYIYFNETIRPGEVWAKEIKILECTFLYSKKSLFSIELNDIPMEEISIVPNY